MQQSGAHSDYGLSSSFPLLRAPSAMDISPLCPADSRSSSVTLERLDVDYVDGHPTQPDQPTILNVENLESSYLQVPPSSPLQAKHQHCNHVTWHAEDNGSRRSHLDPWQHRHRQYSQTDSSIVSSLTQVIVRSLTRGRSDHGHADGAGGGACSGHLQRNTWNAFEGHVGWQSAKARPAPFFADTFQ